MLIVLSSFVLVQSANEDEEETDADDKEESDVVDEKESEDKEESDAEDEKDSEEKEESDAEDEKDSEEKEDSDAEDEKESDENEESDAEDEKESGNNADEEEEEEEPAVGKVKLAEKQVEAENEEEADEEDQSDNEPALAEIVEKKVVKVDDEEEDDMEDPVKVIANVDQIISFSKKEEVEIGSEEETESEAETGSEVETVKPDDESNADETDYGAEEESDDYGKVQGAFHRNPLHGQRWPEYPNGRRPNAGHARARTKDKQLDRFKNTIKEERQSYIQGRKGIGKFLRRDGTRDRKGNPLAQTSPDEMTKAMKQYTPGTVEYEKRRKALLDRMQKHNRKARKDPGSVVLQKESLPFQKDVRKPGLAKKAVERIPVINRIVKMSPEEELILDVSLSLTVGLETGLSMGIEDLSARTALRKWLDLLSVSLPPEWGIHRMIDDLRSQFPFATRSKENFRSIILKHPRPRQGWSMSCQKRRKGTGFSCGFWKLLHTVAVGVAEQRGGKNLIDSNMMAPGTKIFSPMEAADTIRDYINHFFTCRPCRENFIKNYDSCENNRRCDRLTDNADLASTADWKELPLWLWEVHNEVSVRIVNENAQNSYGPKGVKNQVSVKDQVKVIFPNVDTCILCFNSDGTWNDGEVFRFLEKSYWPDSEVDPKHDKLLTFDDDTSSGFGILLFLTMLIVWAVYSVIGKHSSAIQHSVLVARHAVSRGAAATMTGGSKKRTA
jgi:hypothetical protein